MKDIRNALINNRYTQTDADRYGVDVSNIASPSMDIFKDIDNLKDIDKAAERITIGISGNEHILVATDYDSDGLNSAAMLYKSLILLGCNTGQVSVLANTRITGNGITTVFYDRIMELHKKNPIDLIITADHGSGDNDKYILFKEAGIDIIVTDHHQIKEYPTDATVFVNNQREDSTYSKEISGCMVAFLVMLKTHSLLSNVPDISMFEPVIPYVAIATVTDVMCMKEPINRYIIKYGLQLINSSKYMIWDVIRNTLKLNTKITYYELGRNIGPFINTAARTQRESSMLSLLVATSEYVAVELSKYMLTYNNARKAEQMLVLDNLEDEIYGNKYKHSLTLVMDSKFEINGIIAAMAGSNVGLPTVCFIKNNDGDYSGSLRAIVPDFNIHNVLIKMANIDPDMFIRYGGHAGAAGCSIKEDKLDQFKRLFDVTVAAEMKISKIKIKPTHDYVLESFMTLEEACDVADEVSPYGKNWIVPTFKMKLTVKNVYYHNRYAKLTVIDAYDNSRVLFFYYNAKGVINRSTAPILLQPATIVSMLLNVRSVVSILGEVRYMIDIVDLTLEDR